jgi:hypothetical protein
MPNDEELMTVWRKTQHERCARCNRLGVRVGEQDARLVVDVLCYRCFENAPMSFKLSLRSRRPPPQHIYRDAIKGGVHPRMAQRMAEVYGRFVWPTEAN